MPALCSTIPDMAMSSFAFAGAAERSSWSIRSLRTSSSDRRDTSSRIESCVSGSGSAVAARLRLGALALRARRTDGDSRRRPRRGGRPRSRGTFDRTRASCGSSGPVTGASGIVIHPRDATPAITTACAPRTDTCSTNVSGRSVSNRCQWSRSVCAGSSGKRSAIARRRIGIRPFEADELEAELREQLRDPRQREALPPGRGRSGRGSRSGCRNPRRARHARAADRPAGRGSPRGRRGCRTAWARNPRRRSTRARGPRAGVRARCRGPRASHRRGAIASRGCASPRPDPRGDAARRCCR